VAFAQIRASSVAGKAAQAGADEFDHSKSFVKAQNAAVATAKDVNATAHVTSFDIGPDGTVTVTATVTANTVVVERIGFLRNLGEQHSTETASHSLV
jgi:hypothetical protein